MGNYLSTPEPNGSPSLPRVSNPSTPKTKKRRLHSSEKPSSSFAREPPPKKKKLKTTSQYIYETLFVRGENSDITISALGKEWKLHKVYLRQAVFFRSMFQSKWKEASMETINLVIPDDNIDVEALNITFGSLYSEDVLISSDKVVSILAAASLIQLEGLMQQCTEVMKETVSHDNVCTYLKIASLYGQDKVVKHCTSWLETNLMLSQSTNLLREIEPKLLTDVIGSPDLIVIQIEMDIYTMLKKWLFLRLNPDYSGDFKGIITAADAYFLQEAEHTNAYLLETDAGTPYVPVFRALRLQHIIRDFVSCREMEKDHIIPWSWSSNLYRQQWLTMLRIEQSIDNGPTECYPEDFDSNSLRCGRLLMRDTDHCWRWNGYNFGLDLLVSYSCQSPRMLSLKRNVRSQRCTSSVSFAQTRHIIYKIVVASVDDKGQTRFKISTGNTLLSLEKEQERVVLTFGSDINLPEPVRNLGGIGACFPLLITANFQFVNSPKTPEFLRHGHAISMFPESKNESTLGDVTNPVLNDETED